MASGSLPPGFPATEIDGEYYWDGGLVSNTPLQWVLDIAAAPRHARLPGRSVERHRRIAARPGRGGDAAEGDQLFQPHTRQHRPASSACSKSATPRPSCFEHLPARSCATAPKRKLLRRNRRRQGLQHRPADLSREALRGHRQGLRVLAAHHGGALAAPATATPRARCTTPKCCNARTIAKGFAMFDFAIAADG